MSTTNNSSPRNHSTVMTESRPVFKVMEISRDVNFVTREKNTELKRKGNRKQHKSADVLPCRQWKTQSRIGK